MHRTVAKITFEGIEYGARHEETILQALLRQGANVPHSCGKGSCHVCMMQLKEGEVARAEGVAPSAIEASGHILPCVCRPQGEVTVGKPDLAALAIQAEVVGRKLLSHDILELSIAPLSELQFEAGQHIDLIRPDGLTRPYSIASLPGEDYFFRIHVRRIPGGEMTRWLFDELNVGDTLSIRGPFGDLRYTEEAAGLHLLLMATGTGGGALAAVARAALAAGHSGRIDFFHGGRKRADIYLDAQLRELAQQHPNFHYVPCLTQDTTVPHARRGRICDHAFGPQTDLSQSEVFLCGMPPMVEEARYRAVMAGVRRRAVRVDAFDFAHPRMPNDAEKISRVQTDPELWAALEHGPGLTRILTDFYSRVFKDSRLAPFFEGFTPEHVAQKQYAFLADRFSGSTGFFGLNPYNSHHWMVISNELFDYREALFEQVLRDHGLAEPLIRRFLALHELFRSEIVKSAPRGIISNGVEQPLHTDTVECLDIDTVCDSCGEEIPAGTPSRYQHRLGLLNCANCAALAPLEA